MFNNTLTLTIDGVAKTLLRRNQDNYGSAYQFKDADETITMQIRHSTDLVKGLPVNRHNVFIERKVNATPTTFESYWSTTLTLREREGSSPEELTNLYTGMVSLVFGLVETLVIGDN